MEFRFTPEQEMMRDMIREFAQKEVAPIAARVDREGRVPWETLRKAAELDLMGVPFPEEYGGAGAGEVGYCILMEELGKVCTSTTTILGAHIGIAATSIYLGGNEEQKQKYLVPLARGKKIGAFALTEPNAGSDAAALQTTAVRDGDHYVLNGTKIWITNGDIAEVIVVYAVTDKALGPRGITAFIIEPSFPGFAIGTKYEKMGIRASSTAELVFTDCRVPVENVLGQPGSGFVLAMKALDRGRIGLGAASLGGAETALALSVEHAKNRRQFGEPIASKQMIQWMIAEMATRIEALRWLVYHTAWLADTGQRFTRESAMCKLFGSETASWCIDRAMQVHGGMGYMTDLPIERFYRDARISEIFEGTNEIQRIIIAEDIFRQAGLKL